MERLVKSAVLTVLALGLLGFGRTGLLAEWASRLHEELNLSAGSNLFAQLLGRLLNAVGVYRHLTALALSLLAYSALEVTEGVGLARRKRWAEYLTVVATGLLIPFELFELVRRPSLFKVGALALNVAVVGYLSYRKRLFIDV